MTGAVRAALMPLYQAQFTGLLMHLRRIVGDPALAQDLAQQAGLRLLELSPEQVESLRDPRAFLFQIASNLARDALRRRLTAQAGQQVLLREEPGQSPGPETVVAQLEELTRVRAALAQLPERARQVLLLARVDGLSHKEIAARLDIQPKTVENHLARATAMLLARLEPR